MYSALALMLRCVLEKMQNKSKLRSTTKRNKVGDVSLQTKSWVATSAGVNNSNIYFDIMIRCDCTGCSVRCSQLPQPPVRLQRPPDRSDTEQSYCWLHLELRMKPPDSKLLASFSHLQAATHLILFKVLCHFLLKETACWSSSLLFLLCPLFLTSLSHYYSFLSLEIK